MADRASGKGNPVVPKEVFELDKDERWQARLDEARARREVALREKADGQPQKPRPKPWEIEGADVDEPPVINPTIQERGEDKLDFADRLESIRGAKDHISQEPAAVETPSEPVRPVQSAPKPRQGKPAAARTGAPEPRARPQPSLILPGAPDVAELASRYAATLKPPKKFAISDTPPSVPDEEAPAPRGELVSLPTAAVEVTENLVPAQLSRSERRRGIRPLGMAFGLVTLAALPLTTEAPPLETGPEMPVVDGLRLQPALGVTWSLYQPPVATESGEWSPAPSPRRLAGAAPPPLPPAAAVVDDAAALTVPTEAPSGDLNWTNVEAVSGGSASGMTVPDIAPTKPQVEAPPAPPAAPQAASPAPPRPVPNVIENEDADAPLAVPPQTPTEVRTVVEADPLRVTILAPARSDRKLAEEIAADVQNVGHELVRVKDVDYSISERNLRYFHDNDRAAASRMAERYGAELRDFTWFRPSPVEGTAELWLSGRAPARPERSPVLDDVIGQVLEQLGLGTELPDGRGSGN